MKKYSRKREAILEKVRSTDSHPTAEWVYTQLKPDIPDISMATVYRNLSAFVEDGTVVSLGVIGGQEHFDGCVVPHPHFVCSKCGRVIDIDQRLDPYADSAVREQFQLDVTHHELVFYGLCEDCKE